MDFAPFTENGNPCMIQGVEGNIVTLVQVTDGKVIKKKAKDIKNVGEYQDALQPVLHESWQLLRNISEERDILKPSNVLQVTNYRENTLKFYEKQPFFYDKSRMFWLWNQEQSKWEYCDDTDMMNAIDKSLQLSGDTIATHIKKNYLEAFERIGREKMPLEAPKTWIQFKDKVYDLENDKIFPASPSYFFTNPIPWGIGDTEQTLTIDRIFKEWVIKEGIQDESYIMTLYEVIAFCLIREYFIHRIICLVGSGINGKSKFQRLIQIFLGFYNTSSGSLDLLMANNFESAKMYRKLACMMGETNFSELKKTDMLKRLSGEDLIRFEFKNKDSFDAYNYAKIIIATNSLPITSDKTKGFYRRWLIIKFPNEFNEKKDILKEIPEQEYSNLARKCLGILKELLQRRSFTNEGTILERKTKYEDESNPLRTFIEEECIKGPNEEVPFFEFYDAFTSYLEQRGKRIISNKAVGTELNNEGYGKTRKNVFKSDGTLTTWYYITGLTLKNKAQPNDDSEEATYDLKKYLNGEINDNKDNNMV